MYSIALSTEVSEQPVINKKNTDNEIVFTTVKGKKVNDSRLFNEFLLDLLQSPTHSAILKTKVDYTISKHYLKPSTYSDAVDAKDIMNGSISSNDDLTDLLTKIDLDYEIYNAFAFEVIPSKGGGVSSFEYVDYSKLIFGSEGQIYYGSNLEEQQKFDANKKSGIFVYKPCALNTIPTPVYAAAYDSISTEIAIAQYQLSNSTNGFSAGALINFVEETLPSEEDMRKRARQVRDKMVGQKNGGSVHLNWSTSKENAPTIQQFSPNNLDKQYEVLGKQNKDNIVTAHTAVAGELFGIQKEGGVFDTSHLKEAFNIFSNIYIKNRQRIIMQSFNYVFSSLQIGVSLVLEVDNIFYNEDKKPLPPLSDLQAIGFTTEEIKDMYVKYYDL